ncbi:MAG: hypothetical protein CEE40_00160 [Chloroflexi bacterium B3_Chlor]|nr:MAG: hypothetical protein CEE40_00160 [Chloroflexi bacterium B3_Chlor]
MPVGKLNEDVLTFLCQKLEETFGGPCEIGPGLPHPSYAYNERRQQYLSSALLGLLNASTLLVPEHITFDDETYHAHRILADGIDVGADGLPLDVVTAVGPRGPFPSPTPYSSAHAAEMDSGVDASAAASAGRARARCPPPGQGAARQDFGGESA